MATWTKYLAVLMLVGCGKDVELLLQEGSVISSPEAFVCEDGTRVVVGNANNTEYCLGFRCGDQDLSTYDCGNPAMNAAAGTCVETYFAPCGIGGTCTELPDGDAEWSNGARRTNGQMFAPGASVACAQYSQTRYGSGEEYTWFREAPTE